MASTWRSAKLLERYYTTLNTHSHFSILDGTMSVDELVADSTEELLSAFDKNVEQGRARVLAATDEEMQKNWAFKFGEHVAFTNVRTRVVRSFINHLVHHRAQLGVYLRLNNIAIPGMYGPSSDEM